MPSGPFLRVCRDSIDNVFVATRVDEIEEFGKSIGIDKIGVVPAAALGGEAGHLLEWLDRGNHGEMAWMERDPAKRSDPTLLFPGARSVVVIAVNYYTDHKHSDDTQKGKISRYAWGDDYHVVVREKLDQLLEFVRSRDPSAEGKVCVDTAPMMDKAWAVRAGLGWLGKHSNVITKDLGSWVFIGSLILNIELEDDVVIVEDHCGTCSACIDACPTEAIVEPYVVDSRRCLSYATIELRSDELPTEIVENMEGWLYGCDICQDVCPWNRFETPTTETRFEPRLGETSLDLAKVLSMTHDKYVERFRFSSMKRTKLQGLQRNASSLIASIP